MDLVLQIIDMVQIYGGNVALTTASKLVVTSYLLELWVIWQPELVDMNVCESDTLLTCCFTDLFLQTENEFGPEDAICLHCANAVLVGKYQEHTESLV